MILSQLKFLYLSLSILLLAACAVETPPTVNVQATVDAAVAATQTTQEQGTATAIAVATQVQSAVAATLTAQTTATTNPEPTHTPQPTVTVQATARPTATTITLPPTPSQSPEALARAYFLAIADGVRTGDYRLAYSYKSSASRARQSYADFRNGFETTASVEIESVGTTAVSRSAAQVYISVVAGDWTEAGEIFYRRFQYDYTLINENGQWRMDRAQATTTNLSGDPDDDLLGTGIVDPVTAWNGLRLWESIGGSIAVVLPASRPVALLSQPVNQAGTSWLQVEDLVTGRTGWVMARYLIFGSVAENYYSLYWMPGCAPQRPEVELLRLDQDPCAPGAERWSLAGLAAELRGLGLLSAGEVLESLPNAGRPNWMIRITTNSGATRGWIRIGTAVPLPNHPDLSLAGGVWRTEDGTNALDSPVCWLRMGYEWICETN